ncbi:hypothetical protein [Verrucomicrobium spinosum]|uniref:hypothetical protein n=1 Tax=Verrucomicrobium spinosum TaxID=2736 RepID=UPI0001746963|nr:hypothetical protein [Verrucomicrobium spinosum]
MTTTLTYVKNNEQLTLTLETGPLGGILSQEFKGNSSFRKSVESYVSQSSGTYEDTFGLAIGAAKKFGLQLAVQHEGEPPDPDDLEFD